MPTTTSQQESTPTKSDFIRSLPNLPAAEVVEKAKEHGLDFDSKYVWKIRSSSRLSGKTKRVVAVKGSRAKRGPALKRVPAAKRGRPKSTPVSSSSKRSATRADELLVAVAASIGLSRAIEILEAQRQKVLDVLGG